MCAKSHLIGERNGKRIGIRSNIVVNDAEEIKTMTKAINLIFPHQLFSKSPLIKNGHKTYLVEEYLFFKQYKFHKQKIAFHRATMKVYQQFLEKKKIDVEYIESTKKISDLRELVKELTKKKINEVHVIDPVDYWLEKRLRKLEPKVAIKMHDSPLFLNTKEDLSSFFKKEKKSFFQTTFYKQQRKKRNILMDDLQEPVGGKWTYDSDNRKKYPKGKTPPTLTFPKATPAWEEAVLYTEKEFKNNPGELQEQPLYPINYKQAKEWFQNFLNERFFDFGIYEDAIVKHEAYLNHSVLTPMMNVGLLDPNEILKASLDFAAKEDIPINSTEGFVRQIIGWREFIRGMYECKGRFSRTQNFWKFHRKIPASFYDGTTGIEPIDETIKQILKTGYCHHIERLMILGNFMVLCEFHPNEVYRWFMELFIDAYDWVMVPNVYGMSQFADGGTFATKPYISGSNYIKKMSNYPKGDWQPIWDGLFWRFLSVHQDFFKKNPRLSMLVSSLSRMTDEKRETHFKNAEDFLAKIS